MVILFQSKKKGRDFKKEMPEITRYKMVFYAVRSLNQHFLFLPLLLYLYIEQVRQSKVSEVKAQSVIEIWFSTPERFSCL